MRGGECLRGEFEEAPLKMKVEVKGFIGYTKIQLMVKIARFMSTFQSAWMAVCCGSGEVKNGCWIKANSPCSCSRFCLSVKKSLLKKRGFKREKGSSLRIIQCWCHFYL